MLSPIVDHTSVQFEGGLGKRERFDVVTGSDKATDIDTCDRAVVQVKERKERSAYPHEGQRVLSQYRQQKST